MGLEHKLAELLAKQAELCSGFARRFQKSILQEAIQGHLVPQDPADEPASVLLERINEEKLRLVKDGKLKKKDVVDSVIFKGDDNRYYEQIGKNLIDITDDIPFDIPSNWVWTRIGHLFAHNNGKQLNKGNSAGTLMEYITTSNLYWDGFRLDNLKMMPFEESEIERCQAIKGDLLVCEGGDVGRSCIWTYDYPIMLQNHIHKLRAYLPLCTKYFFYIFYLYNLIGLIGGKGIGIQGFSAKALHNTIIPMPPLKEQERIVKKIETVFNRIKG
ncbi:MAG: restriction endonuclease subunit S [Prevotella sp.]|nr:restriction endonuclease subunit S [Prevotella sp.]